MLVLAQSVKGKEFIYKPETARKVSKASANYIMDIVNQYHFMLEENSNYTWCLHEVDEYDSAYYYAQFRSFTVHNGIVTARVK